MPESLAGGHTQNPSLAPREHAYTLPMQVGASQSFDGGVLGRGALTGHPHGDTHGAGQDLPEEIVVVTGHHRLVKGPREPIG
jgi:hypothetical protein